MTVAQFHRWRPESHADRKWHLVDGVPVCMAPPSPDHARIMARLTYVLIAHVDATMPGCDVPFMPGVIPADRPDKNELLPDIAVTCETARRGSRTIEAPIVLIEILSPSNEDVTRRNAESYKIMASVQEVVLLDSLSVRAERMRRNPDGSWQETATIKTGEQLELKSIAFKTPLDTLYKTTSLAP
jgi:Uma2 family endonuclease